MENMNEIMRKIANYLLSWMFNDIEISEKEQSEVFVYALDVLRRTNYAEILGKIELIIIKEMLSRVSDSKKHIKEATEIATELIEHFVKATLQSARESHKYV